MGLKITVIIVAVVGFAYSLFLSVIERRSISNPTPDNLKDVYDNETYERWKKYTAEHVKLDIVFKAISSLVSIAMLCTNVYALFASLFPKQVALQILSVILLESVVDAVFTVIKSWISTMKIEEKYGFNRTNKKTFVFDQVRSFLLGFALSCAISFLILGLYGWLGGWMVVLFVAVMFAFTTLISFIYPLLSRIGNKFTPLEEGELKDSLTALLNKHNYQVKAIEVMDASRRTTKLNAYFTGFGKMKTIVLYDNLVNAMTVKEICAVFAHELGHGIHKDVLKNQLFSILSYTVMGLTALLLVKFPAFYSQFGFSEINYGFTFILLGILLNLIQPLLSLITNANSRKAEYKADDQAVIEGYGEEMISAFKKLAKENFANLAPSKLNVLLEYSHPPLNLRIENVRKTTKKLNENK